MLVNISVFGVSNHIHCPNPNRGVVNGVGRGFILGMGGRMEGTHPRRGRDTSMITYSSDKFP